jgi:tetratricopeptide (TPR) repeat protein
MEKALTWAIGVHQAGHLLDAARLYQQILEGDPNQPDALHLLGVLRHQQGDHGLAVELMGQAVALQPTIPAFHANLAEAYRALKQFDRAIGCCRVALRLCPDNPEVLSNLGLALQGLGRLAEAAEQFRRAIELRPDFGAAHNNLGLVLQKAGRIDEALSHFRRATELSPDLAAAHTNLGQLLLDLGNADVALTHCEEAVRLQPDRAAVHNNLGNVFRALERNLEARNAYLEALRLDPDLTVALAHLGLVLQSEGKFDEAIPWLKQAVELEPGNATFWQYLGQLFQSSSQPAEAIRCLERARELAPENADVRLALGWALQEEGHLNEAGEHFRAALTSHPNDFQAHLNLGGLREELGQLKEAEASFREAIRLQPRFALAHGRLATLLRGKLPEVDCIALKGRLADPATMKGPRAHVLFALAHVLDAREEFSAAAECLREANAITLGLARGKNVYVPALHERFVDKLLSAFTTDFFARTAGAGLDTCQPVFVFGLPRSGTTLIEQMLAGHPRVTGAGELRFGGQSFESLSPPPPGSDEHAPGLSHIDSTTLHTLAERHLSRLAALVEGLGAGRADRIVDKMPDNYLYLGFLATLFPRATFIHCRRDLRDVAVSCWMTDFRSITWANDPDHMARRFTQYHRLTNHWRATLPVSVLEVEYEDTVTDLEGVARRLLAACHLEWDPACLEFHSLKRPVRTASATQVRQPVYTKSVGRWKNYERELAALFAALPADVES